MGLYAEDRDGLFGSVATYVYEWVAGGFFVVHTAYGCIGDSCVGGIEMIGYDPETGRFRTHFFDSRGNISSEDLTFPGWAASRSGKTGFGDALAAGDFDDDGLADLAVGAPGEPVSSRTGAVNVLYGTPMGLTGSGSQLFTQNSPGLGAVAGSGAQGSTAV